MSIGPGSARPGCRGRACVLPGARSLLPVLGAVLVAVVAGACDESFQPLSPTPVEFSVFGYVDASADTQWIRVMPIRPLMVTSPDTFGASVTLTHLGSGRNIELRDSLFRYADPLHPELGSEGVYLHNFWTAEAIVPGATYRFVAKRDGREPAEAVLQIPRDYDVEVWIRQVRTTSDRLRITGLKRVAFLAGIAHFHDQCGSGVDTTWYGGGSVTGEVHDVWIARPEGGPREGCGPPGPDRQELWIVGTEAPWPGDYDGSLFGLGESDRSSNVSNAFGYLGGVLTKTVPYENCEFQGEGSPNAPPPAEHCRLRYDSVTATLAGTVDETRCNEGPMDSVTVELRQLEGEPAALRRIRTTLSDRTGEFRIGALEPGIRYGLKARAKPEPVYGKGEIDIYTIHTDTLTFTPGARVGYDIRLRRLVQCGSEP